MKRAFAVGIMCGMVSLGALGQKGFPTAAMRAKTVAIVNDAHNADVAKGAKAELKAWGRFKLTEDAYDADLTLRFEKSSDDTGSSSDKPGKNGKPSYSYSMTFGSSIHMKAYTKTGTEPFYVTKTGDSKQQAGVECVDQFRQAYRFAEKPPQ